MALDLDSFKAALKQVFADGLEASSSDEVAEALATAIHTFVASAEVSGVEVDVSNDSNVHIGRGAQVGSVPVS